MRTRGVSLAVVLAVLLALPITAQVPESADLNAIYKIKEEGFQRSKVMEIISYLTDVPGGRLTGSPNIKAAGDYAVRQMTEWGLVNAKLEPWGPFGRGWQNERFSANVVTPQPYPLIGYPRAWTPGTSGSVTSEAVIAVLESEQDFDKFRGKLKGKFVLAARPRQVQAQFEAPGKRFTEAQLAELATQPVPTTRPPSPDLAAFRARQQLQAKLAQFFLDEGVAVWLEPGPGDGGTVFVGGGARATPRARRRCRASCWPSSTTAASSARWKRTFPSQSR